MSRNRGHAIVLGASMAGLGTARVLSEHFQRVTIVERDVLSTDLPHQSRKGVPQGNHGHALLASGCFSLEALFPGVLNELVAEGASRGDVSGDFLWYAHGDWKLRADSGVSAILASRPCLESAVRHRVRQIVNVNFLANHDAQSPTYDIASRRVSGLSVRDRASGAVTTLPADLVVDATGRGSQAPKWLASWGFGDVQESRLPIDLGYASTYFERRPGECHGAIGAVIGQTPPKTRGAALFAVEGMRWVVTLGGVLHDFPPTDLAGFREFARSLPADIVYELIKNRDPLEPIHQYRFPEGRNRHYEALPSFPAGFLIVGDAICSFNPLYGQGMSVALLQATAMGQCLRAGDAELAPRFFACTKGAIKGPWSIVKGEELRFPEVEGPRPFGHKLMARYLDRLHRVAATDPLVSRRFYEVVHLLQPPHAVLAPSIAWRVLTGGRGPGETDFRSKQLLNPA